MKNRTITYSGFVWLPVLLGILVVIGLGGAYVYETQKPTTGGNKLPWCKLFTNPIIDCMPGYRPTNGGTNMFGCQLADRCVRSGNN